MTAKKLLLVRSCRFDPFCSYLTLLVPARAAIANVLRNYDRTVTDSTPSATEQEIAARNDGEFPIRASS
jgi:hypothetical protein